VPANLHEMCVRPQEVQLQGAFCINTVDVLRCMAEDSMPASVFSQPSQDSVASSFSDSDFEEMEPKWDRSSVHKIRFSPHKFGINQAAYGASNNCPTIYPVTVLSTNESAPLIVNDRPVPIFVDNDPIRLPTTQSVPVLTDYAFDDFPDDGFLGDFGEGLLGVFVQDFL
jgi:hypothetical protein